MRSNESGPRPRPRLAAGALVAALAIASTGCSSSEDPAPSTTTADATASSGSGTPSGTQVPGTAPPTVVRRPAGTAPPGTTLSPSGTAPPGTNVDLPNGSIEPDEVAQDVTWTANATDYQDEHGLVVAYDCTPDGIEATVWGDRIYTDDSSVCTAAVFEGLITVEGGGRVVIQIVDGRDDYDAATANRITTLAYATWPGSFWFPGT